ncbi:hypothetical protein INT45_000030, partial [Circinella minor]
MPTNPIQTQNISSSSNNVHSNTQPSQDNLVGDYIISSKIGQGSFATVYKAQHK